ncbi:zinc-dependent dehydrogenase [soil metagenome]
MLAAVFRGPGELKVGEVSTPEISPDEVLVKVGANTVCGTDVRILRGEKTRGIAQPVVLGHELSGHIAEIGNKVEGYEVGAPVVMAPAMACLHCFYCKRGMENLCQNKRIMGNIVDGGLAEYVSIPGDAVRAGNLFMAGKDLPPEQLALAEPLACCINGQSNYQVDVDDAVLVMEAGPIGLFHLQLALLAGARTVIVSNRSEARRNFATELGAHVTVDPASEDLWEVVAEHTDGLGADVSVICVGRPQLVNDALRATRKGGQVNVFAGLAGDGWSEIEANLIHYNELVLTGASDSKRRDYDTALRLIESGRIDAGRMVTHRFPLKETEKAIETSAGGEGIKVAVMP